MSAIFIVKFLGEPIQFGELNAGRAACSVVESNEEATEFTAESDALMAVHRYGLSPACCSVVCLN